jgi:hypothetical protein
LFSLRPERISLLAEADPPDPDRVEAAGRIESLLFHGATRRLAVALTNAGAGTTLLVALPAAPGLALRPGSEVRLAWPRAAMHVMDET